jgi:hypothetical protein
LDQPDAARTPWLLALVVFLGASGVFGLYGDQGELYRDHGIVLYAGQQFADGVPPYVGIFDHKGPGGAVVAGCGVWLGGVLGSGDVAGARLLFLLLSAASVAAVFLLAAEVFRSPWPGLLAAASFLTYWGFGQVAGSGPEPKTPMVLFQALALWLTVRRRWFAAGLTGSLAFLVWQPMAVLVAATMFLGWRSAPAERGRALGAAALGGALPVAVTVGYYAVHGALFEFVDGMALFNLTGMENEQTIAQNVKTLVATSAYAFKAAGVTIPLGAAALVLLMLRCLRDRGAAWSADPLAPVLLTFPAPVLWSVLDFQGFPDFFCFMPYTALGFGWLLAEALERASLGTAGKLFVVLVLTGSAAVGYRVFAPDQLGAQREATEALVERYGEDARFLAVGAPQVMVLLERQNPTPYLYMMRGIQNHVEAHVEGGFDGWLGELSEYDADVVLTTDYARSQMGEYGDAFGAWLEAGYTRGPAYYGKCVVYERNR